MQVLVVDDSDIMRNIIIKELRNLDLIHIEQASDGIEAIRRISSKNYDLVVLDIAMPKADGLAVLAHIKQVAPQIRVIICSSLNDKETVMKAVRGGIHDFILKPFSVEKLRETLQRNISTLIGHK